MWESLILNEYLPLVYSESKRWEGGKREGGKWEGGGYFGM